MLYSLKHFYNNHVINEWRKVSYIDEKNILSLHSIKENFFFPYAFWDHYDILAIEQECVRLCVSNSAYFRAFILIDLFRMLLK